MRESLIVLGMCLAACSDPGASPDAPECAADIEWGKNVAGVYQAFRDNDEAEITLGFQGFRYVQSVMRVAGVASDSASFQFQISVDGQATYVQPAANALLEAGQDGARYSHDVLVFFNDIPMPDLVGRATTVLARGVVSGCRGVYTATVRLVDNSNCVDQPDGGSSCQAVDAGL